MHRPLQVFLLWLSGHQTQINVWINLLWPCVCAVASEVRSVGYSELVLKAVGTGCALLHVACNVIQVAAQFRYMPDESFGSRGRVQQCWECRQATWSSYRLETQGEHYWILGESLALSCKYMYYILRVC